MLKSMTGFGRSSVETEAGEVTWELRSVNHRYLAITRAQARCSRASAREASDKTARA